MPQSQASLRREVFALAWPAIVHALLHTVVFIVDRAMLGHYGTAELSSMQVSGPLMWSVVAVFTSFVTGVVAVVARAWGAKQYGRARKAGATSVLLAAVSGLLVGCAMWFGVHLILSPFQLPAESTGHALVYLRTMAFVVPFLFIAFAGTAVMRATGDTRTPMWIAVMANLVNIVGNYALIFGNFGMPRWGIFGAAVATGGALALEALVVLLVLRLGASRIRLAPRDLFGGESGVLRSIVGVTLPATTEKVVFHAGFLVFAGMVARLGEVAAAANQACIALESLSFIPAEGFGIAAATVMGQKLGAGQPEQARAGGRAAIGMSILFLGVMGLLFLAIPSFLVGWFTNDSEVSALAVGCLMLAAIAQPSMALGITTAKGLQGAGDTRSPLAVTIVGIWGVRLGACWLLAFHWDMGLTGIWIATAIDWWVRAGLLYWVFRRGRWTEIEL